MAADRDSGDEQREPYRLRARQNRERRQNTCLDAAEEVAEAPGDARREGDEDRGQRLGTACGAAVGTRGSYPCVLLK